MQFFCNPTDKSASLIFFFIIPSTWQYPLHRSPTSQTSPCPSHTYLVYWPLSHLPYLPYNIMRRPIHSPQAERTHLPLVAYQAAMAEQQALVAREQQVLEEIETRKIAIEADTTIARDAFPAEYVNTDGAHDAGSVLTTQYGRPAQMEASSSVERHLFRMALEPIAGETLSVKDGYVFPLPFFFLGPCSDFSGPRMLLACTKYNG